MFDNPAFLLKVIIIVSAIGFIIYRIQVFGLIKSVIFGNKDKKDARLKNKVDALVAKYKNKPASQLDKDIQVHKQFHPEINLLKAVQQDYTTTVYFVNRGDEVYNLEIKSSDVDEISIEPVKKLENSASGVIKFRNAEHNLKDVVFEVKYSDKWNNHSSRFYSFRQVDKSLLLLK